MTGEEKQRTLQLLQHFREGRRLYTMQRFTEAIEVFGQALAIDSADGPTHEFIRRCRDFIKNPPPAGWDGVVKMTEK